MPIPTYRRGPVSSAAQWHRDVCSRGDSTSQTVLCLGNADVGKVKARSWPHVIFSDLYTTHHINNTAPTYLSCCGHVVQYPETT